MADAELIPTNLLSEHEKAPIHVDLRPVRAKYRTVYIATSLLWLSTRVVVLFLIGRLSQKRLGTILREFCQQMGVLWVKVGQLISMRADLASLDVRNELAKLQDRVSGFPGSLARRMIEYDLRTDWTNVFSEFDETPLAAASIGQVHRAVLKQEGIEVAVKVQRPNIQRVYDRDIRMVRLLIRVIELIRFRPQVRWQGMLWEIEEAMREELDYRYEASNMRRLGKSLLLHGVITPMVFDEYSTKRVLVMEFVRGVLMADYVNVSRNAPGRLTDWHEENNVSPKLVAKRLLRSFLRQTFEDNLFHSDLHPGNIVLLRDSRIAFLDFGSAGTLERDFRRKADMFLEALGTREYSKAVDLFFLFSEGLPSQSMEECKSQLIRRLLIWDAHSRVEQLPFEVKTLNRAMDELVFVAADYGVAPVWTFFRMTRAMATMDASLQQLYPEADFHDLILDYRHQRARRLRNKLIDINSDDQVSVQDWLRLQRQLSEDAAFRASVIRRTAQVFESTSSKISRVFGRMFGRVGNMALLTIILLAIVMVIQYRADHSWPVPDLPLINVMADRLPRTWQAWLLILGLLVHVWRRSAKLNRIFVESTG